MSGIRVCLFTLAGEIEPEDLGAENLHDAIVSVTEYLVRLNLIGQRMAEAVTSLRERSL